MAIPVVQLGTGNVGVHALKALITNPEFELTGVWVSSDAKAGKDAAELAGLPESTGVIASTDLDAVLATGPRCAVYNVRANLPDVKDPADRASIEGTIRGLLTRAAELIQRVAPRIWERHEQEVSGQ